MSWFINKKNKITKTNSDHRTIRKIYTYISRNITYNDDFFFEQCLVTQTSAIFTSMMLFKKEPSHTIFKRYLLEKRLEYLCESPAPLKRTYQSWTNEDFCYNRRWRFCSEELNRLSFYNELAPLCKKAITQF